MNYTTIENAAAQHGIAIYGGFHGDKSDGLPSGHQTLLMLGPSTNFWTILKTHPNISKANQIQ